jgi:hypothetical protein
MEALGRLFNLIPIASAKPFRLRGASGVTCVAYVTATGATSTVAVAQDASFGGSFATAAPVIKNIYTSTATDGTAAWTKNTFNTAVAPWTSGPASGFTFGNASNNFPTALVAVFHIFTSELSDPNDYLKITNTGGTSPGLFVLPYDLVSQRGPANLEILGA